MKRFGVLLGAALITAPGAAAPSPAEIATLEDRFGRALARGDMPEAARLHDRIVEVTAEAPADLRPNPIASSASGRFHMATGHPQAALAYLDQAEPNALPEALRPPTLLARARAEAAVGERTAAEATLRALLAAAPPVSAQEAARVELGQLLLATDPRGALAEAQAVAVSADPARRLDAALLATHAHSLLGDREAAAEAAGQAWALVPAAAPYALAGLRVALASGALAAAAGERERLVAMLGLANPDSYTVHQSVRHILPLCGDKGLKPDDYLIVAVYEDGGSVEHRMPAAASRAAAIAPFLEAFAGRDLLEGDGQAPGGTVMTLRCRTVVSAGYRNAPPARDPALAWFAARGLHHLAGPEVSDASINALADRIDSLAGSLGTDHPRLVPLRLALSRLMEQRAASGGDIELWQLTQLQDKIYQAMRRAGAGTLVPTEADEAQQKKILAATSPQEAQRLLKEATLGYVRRLPIEMADQFYQAWASSPLAGAADKAEIGGVLAERLAATPGHPRARAVNLQLAAFARERGDLPEARRWHAKAGLRRGLCEAADETVRVETQEITDDDYPLDAVLFGLKGGSVLEFDAAPNGTATRHRILIAAPSLIFDTVVAQKLGTFKLTTPLFGGKAAACSGVTTAITWRLPEKEEGDPAPIFRPPDPGNS